MKGAYTLPRLLMVGCGDVGMRILRYLPRSLKIYALTSSPNRMGLLRAAGAIPVLGNLDDPSSLGRLGGIAPWVMHLAPPPGQGTADTRTQHLIQALLRGGGVRRMVYMSTTGVYGDCDGQYFDETRAVNPQTPRAMRRVDAEQRIKHFGRISDAVVSILRVPGIYAFDREAGNPCDRVRKKSSLLHASFDVYTNHIHADDLAKICVAALFRAGSQRAYHACDDAQTLMGDHFDTIADYCGLERANRYTPDELQKLLSPMQWSFMNESRRLSNNRIKRELRFQLQYPNTLTALQAHLPRY